MSRIELEFQVPLSCSAPLPENVTRARARAINKRIRLHFDSLSRKNDERESLSRFSAFRASSRARLE